MQRTRYIEKPSLRTMGRGRELIVVRSDGVELPVEISLTPIPAVDEIRIVCVIRDITARKRIEKELRELNADLEQRVTQRTQQLQSANLELEMLSYSIAHDLRAPLRAIHGFSVRLRAALSSAPNDEVQHCLNVVTARAIQISSMIDDYLRLLRIGRRELSPQVTDMRSLIVEVAHELDIASLVRVNVGPSAPIVVDRELLHDVWVQLLSNAVKFSSGSAPPVIDVSAFEDERHNYFTVQDNGVGFDQAYAGKLFHLFERLHTAREYPGNGIGLCLVKQIVERHNGGATIESKPNQGALATFWLPKEESK